MSVSVPAAIEKVASQKKSAAPRSLVVMFDRFGPYHIARLNALSVFSCDFTVTGLECFGESDEYEWHKVSTPPSFQRRTLFPEHRASQSDAEELTSRVRGALEAAQPEAVAVTGWSHLGARAALQWCVDSRIPAIVMSESTAHDAPRTSVKEWIKGQIVGLFSAALVGGRLHADYLVQLGFQDTRIFSGYDVVDNAHFAREKIISGTQNIELSASRPILPTSPFFLASARFIEKKNLLRMVEAYAIYREQSSAPWDLVLLGDGPLRSALCSQLLALGLQDSVHMPGFKQYDELPEWYARAGAFIHASTTEQWGLVVNEAMAARLPVLVSDRCGCAPDLVKEGCNGFTFDPSDQRQLSALLVDMALRPNREAMGLESERIIRNWDTATFAAGMKAAVEKGLQVGPIKPTLFQHAILTALLRR